MMMFSLCITAVNCASDASLEKTRLTPAIETSKYFVEASHTMISSCDLQGQNTRFEDGLTMERIECTSSGKWSHEEYSCAGNCSTFSMSACSYQQTSVIAIEKWKFVTKTEVIQQFHKIAKVSAIADRTCNVLMLAEILLSSTEGHLLSFEMVLYSMSHIGLSFSVDGHSPAPLLRYYHFHGITTVLSWSILQSWCDSWASCSIFELRI